MTVTGFANVFMIDILLHITSLKDVLDYNDVRYANRLIIKLQGDSDEVSTKISYSELVSLETYLNEKGFTYQVIATVWLVFFGRTLDQIRNITVEQALNFKNEFTILKEFPNYVQDKFNDIVNKTLSETKMTRGYRSGVSYDLELINKSYFIRKLGISDTPVSKDKLQKHLEYVKKVLNKSILREVNIRKSGMLFFGYCKALEYKPKSVAEFKQDILPLLSKYYYEYAASNYMYTLFGLNDNLSAFKDFYNYIFTEDINRLKSAQKSETDKNNQVHKKVFKVRGSLVKASPWEKNKNTGDNGEALVLNYLESKSVKIYQVEDYYGFDLYSLNLDDTEEYIEVNTLTNRHCAINLTSNEYIRAEYYYEKEDMGNHKFYLVVLNDIDNSTNLYIFNDLLKNIGLKKKFDKLFRIVDIENVYHNNITIKLADIVFNSCDEKVLLQDNLYLLKNI